MISQEEEVCELYKQGLSIYKIADILPISKSTVWNILKREKVERREKVSTKYNFKRNFFKNIDEDSAYFLGFICADGHLSHNMLEVAIHKKDKEVLEQFISCCNGSSNQIKKVKGRNLLRLRLCSTKLVCDLNKLGVPTGNKTFILEFPLLENEFIPHFIRGYIDGDGCFHHRKENNSLSITVCGTKNIVEGISKNLGFQGNFVYPVKNIFVFRKTVTKATEIKQIYDYLYPESDLPHLKRKREVIMNVYEKRVKWEALRCV